MDNIAIEILRDRLNGMIEWEPNIRKAILRLENEKDETEKQLEYCLQAMHDLEQALCNIQIIRQMESA